MLSDKYILQQAIERKWITQEQIDLCSIEKEEDQSILNLLIEKDYLSREQIDKLTWEDLDGGDDCFLSSDLKLKVMSVDDLTLDNTEKKPKKSKEKKSKPKVNKSIIEEDSPFLSSSISVEPLVGETSAIQAHAVIGEDSNFEEPIFGEGSTFVQSAAFAEESSILKSTDDELGNDSDIDISTDIKMKTSKDSKEEILEFDNDFLESTFGNSEFNSEFTLSDATDSETSKELDALRSDSAEFTISKDMNIKDVLNIDTTSSSNSNSNKREQKKAPLENKRKSKKTKSQPTQEKVRKMKAEFSKPSSGKSMSTPFGKAAILLKMATEEQVNDALLSQVTDCKGKKIGKIMSEKGYLTNEQIKTILNRQKTATMVCPKCEKKYQIVLFQPGRCYKCKSSRCPEKSELLELRKYLKKRKKMLTLSSTDIEVMGLTAEIAIDKKAIKQSSEKKSNRQVTTSEKLKEVGIHTEEVVANIQIEDSSNSSKSLLWLMLLVIAGGGSFFAYQTGLLDKYLGEEKYVGMEQEYKLIVSSPLRMSNNEEVIAKINSYKGFNKKYPNNPHSSKVKKEISILAQYMDKEVVGPYDVLVSNIKNNISNGKFNNALVVLENYKNENGLPKEKLFEITELINSKSKEGLDQILSDVNSLTIQEKYDEAKNLLQNSRRGQLVANREIISNKLKSITLMTDSWLKVAWEVSNETYPLLQKHQYRKAKTLIEEFIDETNNLTTEENLKKWQLHVSNLSKIWNSFKIGLNKIKNKKYTYFIDIKGKVRKYTATLVAVSSSKLSFSNGRKLPIHLLNQRSISNIIAKSNQKYPSYEITLLCSTWKNKLYIKNNKFTSVDKEILAMYVFKLYQSSIENANKYVLLSSLKNIKYLKDTLSYNTHKEDLASQLVDFSIREKVSTRKKLYQYVKIYLSDTNIAKKIK